MTAGAKAPPQNAPTDFEAAKLLARSQNPADRLQVAQQPDMRAELLYYLAADRLPEIRRTIAGNLGTPRQADLLLARDADPDVRGGLAHKIARLIPALPAERLGQVERMTLEILDTLARDQTAEIRRILSETLKDVANAPTAVINRLARDVELSVAGPVLRHSPILTDDDLLEIILGGPVDGALSAIAERAGVASTVADAIASSNDPAAMAVLLANPSAQIREETLDRIIDRAPQHEPWHAPLVQRPRLPARAAARLAGFVADSLIEVLQARSDLGPEIARQVGEVVRQRLNSAVPAAVEPAVAAGPEPAEPVERPADRAKRLAAEGKLDEALLNSALADGDRAMVMAGLSVLSGLDPGAVERVLGTHSARAVTSLVWKAGLSMRFARQVQLRLARISPKSALNPRDGTDYPMTESEMRWQLDFFGGGA